MPKLSGTAFVILSHASSGMRGAKLVLKYRLKKKLISEQTAVGPILLWREEGECRFTLVVFDARIVSPRSDQIQSLIEAAAIKEEHCVVAYTTSRRIRFIK